MKRIDLGKERRTSRDRRASTRTAEADALAAGLDRGEIEVLFQPLFAAADGALLGAEALARWRHPEHVVVGGEALFEAADRAGLVDLLSEHIMRAALSEAARWREPLRLSLNVTATDLAAPGFAERIAGAVADAGFAPGRLTLEITEQALVADVDRSAQRLRVLTRTGIRVALDDFGAGFCNFGYLKRLPLHYLKLDRSMINGIDEDPRDLAVLRGIVSMARALGLEVVAEGIERESQRTAAGREGCAAWQGFLGGRPMTAAEFAKLVTARWGRADTNQG
jgi:EAL domain-containing protein (putative c-di-GMP-specific phosphodiesterase class I)